MVIIFRSNYGATIISHLKPIPAFYSLFQPFPLEYFRQLNDIERARAMHTRNKKSRRQIPVLLGSFLLKVLTISYNYCKQTGQNTNSN
jgi:hypothetical protein